MERITETIKECDKNGKHTESQFKQWHQTVKSVRLAVIETQSKFLRISKAFTLPILKLTCDYQGPHRLALDMFPRRSAN